MYGSPASLPGKYKWLTKEEDVRAIEKLMGMPGKIICAPLWVSGDNEHRTKCKQEISWLDIVSSDVEGIHGKEMIACVILGDKNL